MVLARFIKGWKTVLVQECRIRGRKREKRRNERNVNGIELPKSLRGLQGLQMRGGGCNRPEDTSRRNNVEKATNRHGRGNEAVGTSFRPSPSAFLIKRRFFFKPLRTYRNKTKCLNILRISDNTNQWSSKKTLYDYCLIQS